VAFPVAGRGDVVDGAEDSRVLWAEDRLDLIASPDVELPLHPLAVRVLARIEGAGRVGHFAEDVVESLFGHAAVFRVSRRLPCFDIGRCEQGIVVEHLLEVRDEPALVGAVAVEAAADLVANAPRGHVVQRLPNHV
jgi:hypothetical protein